MGEIDEIRAGRWDGKIIASLEGKFEATEPEHASVSEDEEAVEVSKSGLFLIACLINCVRNGKILSLKMRSLQMESKDTGHQNLSLTL